MADLETDFHRERGVTFVRAVVTNTQTTRQHVRVRNCLDGPTWPPRDGRVPVPEWRGDTWERTLEPDQTVGFGFVTPVEPTGEILEVVSEKRAVPDAGTTSTRAVVAELDEWSPPSELPAEDP